MSSSNSPCAACKLLRQKCTQECAFAPYFPPDQPNKFAFVHKVFGASNVSKLLNELHATQREDAVNSLYYEAEARLRDPVYGCVGLICLLQQRLKHLTNELEKSKRELALYVGPQSMHSILQPPYMLPQHAGLASPSPSMVSAPQHNIFPMPGGGSMVVSAQYQRPQQHYLDAQPLAAAVAVGEQRPQPPHYLLSAVGHSINQQQHSHQPHHPWDQEQLEALGFSRSGFGSGAAAVTAAGLTSLISPTSPSRAVGSFDGRHQNYQSEQHNTQKCRDRQQT